MDKGTIHGIYTLLFMFTFIGMAVWVYLPRRKKTYDDAASLPFHDEKNGGRKQQENSRQD